jgi:acyl-CoA reductase-like NAD-dependent aldehyde dehydrogenase
MAGHEPPVRDEFRAGRVRALVGGQEEREPRDLLGLARAPVRNVMGRPTRRTLRREPYGVVGAITPWNVPLHLINVKLGPALASGNTSVHKPPPDTPWTGATFARIVAEKTEIPPGVVNVITSSDRAVGEVLVADRRVDLVSFTGSTATGKRIMQVGASNVKRIFLELGGKSAHIVLDDVDPAAIAGSFTAGSTHAGQGCSNLTRILLPRSRYAEGPRDGRPRAAGARAWLLHRADRLRRRAEREFARAGRDLRAGPLRDSLRGRRRRRPDRERLELRALGRRQRR